MFTVKSQKSGKEYILHVKEGKTPFYYFSGSVSPQVTTATNVKTPDALPEGFEVFENERTGLPMLRRKK